jgi:hypothetical protein
VPPVGFAACVIFNNTPAIVAVPDTLVLSELTGNITLAVDDPVELLKVTDDTIPLQEREIAHPAPY